MQSSTIRRQPGDVNIPSASMLVSPGVNGHTASPPSPRYDVRRRPQKMSPYTSPLHEHKEALAAYPAATARPREPTARQLSPYPPGNSSSNGSRMAEPISTNAFAAYGGCHAQAQMTGTSSLPTVSINAAAPGLLVPAIAPVAVPNATAAAAAAVPPLGSELYDAIVQTADPRHPDHAAWKERYGGIAAGRSPRHSASSLPKRDRNTTAGASTGPSRASQDCTGTDDADTAASLKRNSAGRSAVRRTRPAPVHAASTRDSDADDTSDLSDGHALGSEHARSVRGGSSGNGSSPKLVRASSSGSASKGRRRRRATEKGKLRAPPLPIPPPRVTSSTRWQETFGSPAAGQLAWQPDSPTAEAMVGSEQAAALSSTSRLAPSNSLQSPYTQRPATEEPATGSAHRLANRNKRPLPTLPTERVSSPTSSAFASANAAAGDPIRFVDPASPTSAAHSTYAGSVSIDHSVNGSTPFSAAALPHSAATAAARTEADSTPPSFEERERQPRSRTKTLEKGFFTFPRSMFTSKSSQRSLDAALHSPPVTLSPPTPVYPAVPRASYDAENRLRLMFKIQQILGSEVVAEPGAPMVELAPEPARKTSIQVARVPVPPLRPPQDRDRDWDRNQRGMKIERTLDQRVFPMRRDEEFQANDSETSDSGNDGMDAKPGASFLPTGFTSTSSELKSNARPGMRAPGVVRRSLDSIVSPFRASLITGSKSSRRGPSASAGQTLSPKTPELGRQSMDTAREGRRSMSESRLVRPFLRQRLTKNSGRPLSRINDGPEPSVDGTQQIQNSREIGAFGNGLPSRDVSRTRTVGTSRVNQDETSGEAERTYSHRTVPKDISNEWQAGKYDPRSSILVDAGHTFEPCHNGAANGPTPKSTSVATFQRPDQRRLKSEAVGAQEGRGQCLLPAAELYDERDRSRAQREESTKGTATTGHSAFSRRHNNAGLNGPPRLAGRREDSHRPTRSRMPQDEATPLPSSSSFTSFADLTSEDKRKILAQNTYFLPTKESRSRPPSANGSLNAHGFGAPNSESQHSGAFHGSLASASSCRSLASSYTNPMSGPQMQTSPSANELSFDHASKESATPTSQSRGRFAGLFSRVKGTLTPGRTPPSASLSSFNSPVSTSVMTPSQSADASISASAKPSHTGKFESPAAIDSPMPGANGPPTGLGFQYEADEAKKKQERLRRLRAKSLASGRKKSKTPGLDSSENFEKFISTMRPGEKISTLDEDWRRKLLTEAADRSFGNRPSPTTAFARSPSSQGFEPQSQPQSPAAETPPMPLSAGQTPESGGRTLRNLLRKKKTSENLDELIQSFVAAPPKMTHLDVAEEAPPRPSMSSTRGFDVTNMDEGLRVPGSVAPLTIRKTLSPALLSERVDVDRDSIAEAESEDGRSSPPLLESPDEFAEVLQSAHNLPKADGTEVLAERDGMGDGVQAPLRRFIGWHPSIDRLSRVEEVSLGDSLSIDSADSYAAKLSLSVPVSPLSRSFGEHRQIRRSISGTLHPPAVPRALELGGAGTYEYGKRSMDVSRPRNLDQLVLGTFQPQPFPSEPSPIQSPTVQFKDAKSPRKMSFGDSLSPAWSRPSFSVQRNTRTSFSQDRDRAPVASPISPPKNYGSKSPALVQAMKKLRISGKRSKSFNKGIGPGDVIIPNFDDYDDDDDDDDDDDEGGAFDGIRPSMNLARPSMSASRPSMSASRPSMSGVRPSVSLERKSFDTSGAGVGRSNLASAEMMTKLLHVHANAMVATPMTATFLGDASEMPATSSITGVEGGMASETDISVHTAAEYSGDDMVGLGIGALVDMPNASQPSLSTSTSSGDLRGLKISDAQGNNLLKTPDASSLNGGAGGFVYIPKTPELMAFEDMLGKFGQKERALLKGISARAGTTPHQTPGLGRGECQKDHDFGGDVSGGMPAASSGSGSTNSVGKKAGEA